MNELRDISGSELSGNQSKTNCVCVCVYTMYIYIDCLVLLGKED